MIPSSLANEREEVFPGRQPAESLAFKSKVSDREVQVRGVAMLMGYHTTCSPRTVD